jgi:tetratricopeptide (TPR) repeat protein
MLTVPAQASKLAETSFFQLLSEANESMKLRDYESAMDRLQLAQHLVHREDGVLSARQNPVLEKMAKIYLAQGSFSNANKMMELRHRSIAQSSNHSPEAMAPSWQKLGHYYQRTLQPKKSQLAYQEALILIKEHGLPQGEMAKIQLGMLKNQHLLVTCCDIETARKELANITLTKAQWLALGDLAMLARQYDEAELFYAKSGATLPAAPIGVNRIDHLARSYVQATLQRRSRMSIITSAEMTPTQLVGVPLPLCESRVADISGQDDYANYAMEFDFYVNNKGKVRRVKKLSSNAPSAVTALVREQLAGMRYRPELVEGRLQEAKVKLTQQFNQPANAGPLEQQAATQLGCVAAAHALEQNVFVAGLR